MAMPNGQFHTLRKISSAMLITPSVAAIHSTISSVSLSRPIRQHRPPSAGIEADQHAPCVLDDRPLDQRWVGLHQPQRLGAVDIRLVGFAQAAERRAAAVEQRLPADRVAPSGEPGGIGAFLLVVVERVADAVHLEPATGLLDGVAVGDAVERNLVHRWSCGWGASACGHATEFGPAANSTDGLAAAA